MVEVRRLGPKVGSRLAPFCIHRVNRMNSRNDSESLLLLLLLLLLFGEGANV